MADQKEIDSIPDHLKTKYIPLLKELFNEMSRFGEAFEASADPENDPAMHDLRKAYLDHAEQTLRDFTNDGGTPEQWNILAPAVHYGHFGP